MLTSNQLKILKYIERYIRDNHGVSPSYDEMKHAMGLASKSGINRLIYSLKERGFITNHPFRARSIRVLVTPDQYLNDDVEAAVCHSPERSNEIPIFSLKELSFAISAERHIKEKPGMHEHSRL